MFSLLLLPPVCGLCLFLGLLVAPRGLVVRLALTLVLSGLAAPVLGLLAHTLLVELPFTPLLVATALVTASLLWRLVPVLPVPTGNVRGLCWILVLTSCTLITVGITAGSPSPLLLHLAFTLRLLFVVFLCAGAHLLLSLLLVPARSLPVKQVSTSRLPRKCVQPALPLLTRPLELVGADAPYYPLALALTAGKGPAAAFSLN